MNVCVIVPTYNESDNIETVVRRVSGVLPEAEILVVDDNSPDGTADCVRQLQGEFPRLNLLLRTENRGFAQSYLDGFRFALSRAGLTHIVTMDADLSHDPRHLRAMIDEAQTCDVVVGSRYVAGGQTSGWERWRILLSGFANFYCRSITGLPLRDCTAGFSLIALHSLRSVPLASVRMSGYAFLMELKYLLWKHGARLAEVPIQFQNRAHGESKISGHIIAEGMLAPFRLRMRRIR